MENNHTTPHEMTNAEFLEKIKQECENDEELKEEIREITGIFLRAIVESLKEEENELEEKRLKFLKKQKNIYKI